MFTKDELMDAEIEHRYAEENQGPCKVTKASPELLEELNKKLGPLEKYKLSGNKERSRMSIQKKTENRIVAKIIAGHSLTEISKDLDVSRTTVSQVARMNGLAKKLMDNLKTESPAGAEYYPTAEEPVTIEEPPEEPVAVEEPPEEPVTIEEPPEEPVAVKELDTPVDFSEIVKAPKLATEIVISTSKLSEKYALSYLSARAVEAILSGDTHQAAEYLKV